MAIVLAYVDAVPGRLYPLVPTFQELMARGHRVPIHCGKHEAALLHGIGLDAQPLAPEIETFEPDDLEGANPLRRPSLRPRPIRRSRSRSSQGP